LFCVGCFWGKVSWAICLGWLQTSILLIYCLLSSKDYRREAQVPGCFSYFSYRVSSFLPKPAWTIILLIYPSCIARTTGICHHTRLLVKMESRIFLLGLAYTIIFLSSQLREGLQA
jgi:Fe2+ transport system protein B